MLQCECSNELSLYQLLTLLLVVVVLLLLLFNRLVLMTCGN